MCFVVVAVAVGVVVIASLVPGTFKQYRSEAVLVFNEVIVDILCNNVSGRSVDNRSYLRKQIV